MLRHAPATVRARAVQADAAQLPFTDGAFDVAFSAYGALPFTPAADRVLAEVHRVLRPGGRWVFSVTHPVRWAFPDDPGPVGLRATLSYFSRAPYVERGRRGEVVYAEYHRTVGDWVRLVVGAGFTLTDLVEPEWPDDLDEEWGGWSRLRGERLPGTAILVCDRG
jgi:SAM-dependent methyltransferase